MGLIPQSFIEELLARVDIVEVINSRVPLRKSGRNYMACCPFHQEKTPSFSVVPDKQFFNCFGCGVAGSALKFVMTFDNLDFKDAIHKLAQDAGIEVPVEQSDNKQGNDYYQQFYNILEYATKYYQQNLKHNSEAKAYLQKRSIDKAVAEYFKLGFAKNSWDELSKLFKEHQKQLNFKSTVEQALEHVGLWIAKTDDNNNPTGNGYDRFRNRLMFPIRDIKGRTIAYGGRVLDDSKPKYLNSPETKLFHKSTELYGLYESILQNNTNKTKLSKFVIVEGYLDVISLFQHGINYAVATLGTATSYRHLAKLFKYCSEVIYCFDGDEAGKKAAWRALENSLPALYPGRVIKFLFLPDGHDPDSYVKQYGKSGFEEMLQQSVLLTDYLFKHQQQELEVTHGSVDLSNVEAKVSFIKLCKPLINKVPDGDFKIILETELAKKCQLDQASVEKIFEQPEPAHTMSNSTVSFSHSESLSNHASRYGNPVIKKAAEYKLSIWRRAALLLLHNPEFCHLVSGKVISSLNLINQNSASKGISLFMYLYEGLCSLSDNNSEVIQGVITIPEFIDKLSDLAKNNEQAFRIRNFVIQLLETDPIVTGDDAKHEFTDLLAKIDDQVQSMQMDLLKSKIAQSGLASLTPEEKSQLQQLLSTHG